MITKLLMHPSQETNMRTTYALDLNRIFAGIPQIANDFVNYTTYRTIVPDNILSTVPVDLEFDGSIDKDRVVGKILSFYNQAKWLTDEDYTAALESLYTFKKLIILEYRPHSAIDCLSVREVNKNPLIDNEDVLDKLKSLLTLIENFNKPSFLKIDADRVVHDFLTDYSRVTDDEVLPCSPETLQEKDELVEMLLCKDSTLDKENMLTKLISTNLDSIDNATLLATQSYDETAHQICITLLKAQIMLHESMIQHINRDNFFH